MQYPHTTAGQATEKPASEPNAAGASHTPGPWVEHHYLYLGGIYEWALQDEKCAFLLFNFHPVIAPDEAAANARLIAACPTMYNYVTKRAAEGDGDAVKILEVIHASRT